MFHAPSFGDEDFELTTLTTLRSPTSASEGGQQLTSTMLDHLHSCCSGGSGVGGRHDDDDKSSPTSPDTGCWSSPEMSRSPSCEVEPAARRSHGFQQGADGGAAVAMSSDGADDAEICLLKLPAPDEFHIPDIRYSEFYRHHHHHHYPQQLLNVAAVTVPVSYATPPQPPPPPRYLPGYGSVMRPAAGSTDPPCVLMDGGGGRLPLRPCDRGPAAYSTTPTVGGEFGAPAALCYNGAGVGGFCNSGPGPAGDVLLRQDAVCEFQTRAYEQSVFSQLCR